MVLSFTACSKDSGNGGSKEKDAVSVQGSTDNTYETPLKLVVAQANEQNFNNYRRKEIATLNGFCQEEATNYQNLLDKSTKYDKAANKDQFDKLIQEQKNNYGENYKYSYKINSKEALGAGDLKHFQTEILEYADDLKMQLDDISSYDADDWAEEAKEIGLSVTDVKAMVECLRKIQEKLTKANVTEGYVLKFTYILNGSKLETPEEKSLSRYVYKVDGRWVDENFLYTIR